MERENFELNQKEEAYKLEEKYFFKNSSYEELLGYWDSTLFIADKKEDCEKIKEFFKTEIHYYDIPCKIYERNITNETFNIFRIENKNNRYEVSLTSKKVPEGYEKKKNKEESIFNKTELQEIVDIFNYLNITNISDIDTIIEDIKDIQISPILEILNISGFTSIPFISDTTTIGDLIIIFKAASSIFNSEEEKTLFDDKDLDQDKIINPFYVNKHEEIDDNNNILDILSKSKNGKHELFFELQSVFSRLIIYLEKKEIGPNFKMTFGINPYPKHYRFTDEYDYGFYSFLAFVITLQFSLISYNFNLRMIDEKENKLNILLERQGISKFKYNCSWLITFFSLFFLSILGTILILISYLQFHYAIVIINAILFSFSIYCVCIFFTTCLKTTKTGTTAVKFYNFGSILLGFVIVLSKTSKFTKIIFGFIPQINFYMSLCIIFNLNNFDKITWDIFRLRASKMSIMEVFILYLVDIIFYLGLTIFIQSYKDSGLNFFLYIKSFFTHVSRKAITSYYIEENNNSKIKFDIYHEKLSLENQKKSENNEGCLKIQNISKSFGDLKAVDKFNGELFENEIFCLLGHNGAGKSTTINMISGILDPDVGDIFLNGKSIVTNKDYLYKNIGLCQQEDIYFDYLTVEEHLKYMCKIKKSKVDDNEINNLIKNIGLENKKNSFCGTLSGGQKRKLCIALALIGDSKIILLDEPTSGMDVIARRELWEFLKNYKKNKIILLTTHFLDEAEYLGDRIGIMSDGQFVCSGTSSFLKSKYPCGFNINFIVNDSFDEKNKKELYKNILNYEKNAQIKIASKSIFSVNIQSNNEKIEEIFEYIEQFKSKNNNGIVDYTVSSTSLEDVFLKLNNKNDLNDMKNILSYNDKNSINNNLSSNDELFVNVEKEKETTFINQLCAQITRGFFPLYRNKSLFFFELISGLGFVYIFIFFFSDFILTVAETKLNLKEVLENNNIYIYEKNTVNDFLKNSDTYQRYGRYISLKKIDKEPIDLINFSELVYEQALANIAKGSLYIDGTNQNLYNVYNTEVDTSLSGYLYANTMIFVSAFLKEKYDIKATILKEITYNSIGGTSETQDLFKILQNSIVLIIVSLICLFGFVIFLGGLMFEKIKEKRTNIKHLLYLSGSNIWSYWIGFFIVDYIKLLIFNIFLILPIYFVNSAATYFGLNMLSISLSSLSFIYFISFFCSKDDDGAKILFITVFGSLIIISILIILLKDHLKDFNFILSFVKIYTPNIIDITPVTSMGLSFIRIIISCSIYQTLDQIIENKEMQKNLINNLNLGFGTPTEYLITSYIAQAINFVFYSILLMIAENGILGKFIHKIELLLYGNKDNYIFGQSGSSEAYGIDINAPLISENEDSIPNIKSKNNLLRKVSSVKIDNIGSDLKNPLNNEFVKNEIEKLKGNKKFTTRIEGLTKTFYSCCGKRNVRAINNLYLGLEPNEKFGLLGFNGSGKTTTFRAITNEILIDSGSISLFGKNNQSKFNEIRKNIGYCPQINPLFDFMKVKEIIEFYLKLKGNEIDFYSFCSKFKLEKYLNTYTINLSGGNKRKLTFAIAMINNPKLLLLDEPSTGVDPESRRIMWKNINELSISGKEYNMILTTHSMEEAEVLCDTVSWFKAGNFIAKGNPEELKIKYSAGYKLHIKFNDVVINQEIFDLNNYNVDNSFIEGMDVVNSNEEIKKYLKYLYQIIGKIKKYTESIKLYLLGKDNSFEFLIKINKDKESKKNLFVEILNMKKNIKTEDEKELISEINITMESLENILTSLK